MTEALTPGWLGGVRPFLNLSDPIEESPLHSYEPWLQARWMVEGDSIRLGTNMSMYAGYRADLVRESGQTDYEAESPTSLHAGMRGPLWAELVTRLARWRALSDEDRLPVARVMAALTFHRFLAGLLETDDLDVQRGAASAGLGHLLAVSQFLTQKRVSAAPPLMLEIASTAPVDSLARLQAQLMVAYISIDYLGREADAATWLSRADHTMRAAVADMRPFEVTRLEARLLQLRARIRHTMGLGDARADLERAVETLDALRPRTAEEAILRREAQRRALDKLALAQRSDGNLAAAIATASAAVSIDPHDAKAHWLLAELHFLTCDFGAAAGLFRRAATLGPVATARSWFLAGQSYERLGEFASALECYDAAARLDPSSQSVVHARESCRVRAQPVPKG